MPHKRGSDLPHWTPKRIRMKMAEFDITTKEFAELVGVSPNHMSSVIHGNRPITRIVALRIEEVFKQLEAEQIAREPVATKGA